MSESGDGADSWPTTSAGMPAKATRRARNRAIEILVLVTLCTIINAVAQRDSLHRTLDDQSVSLKEEIP